MGPVHFTENTTEEIPEKRDKTTDNIIYIYITCDAFQLNSNSASLFHF